MKFKCSSMLNKLIFFGNKFCTLQLIFNMFSMPYCEWAIFGICYKNRCFIREITFLQERFIYSSTHSFLWSFNRYWWLLQNVEITLWPVYDWFSRFIQLGNDAHSAFAVSSSTRKSLMKTVRSVQFHIALGSHPIATTQTEDFSERHIFNVSLSDDIEHIGCVQKQHVLKNQCRLQTCWVWCCEMALAKLMNILKVTNK